MREERRNKRMYFMRGSAVEETDSEAGKEVNKVAFDLIGQTLFRRADDKMFEAPISNAIAVTVEVRKEFALQKK